jgi:hypothetical protein
MPLFLAAPPAPIPVPTPAGIAVMPVVAPVIVPFSGAQATFVPSQAPATFTGAAIQATMPAPVTPEAFQDGTTK